MTPRELAAVLGRRGAARALDRTALDTLMRRFPDAPGAGRAAPTTGDP